MEIWVREMCRGMLLAEDWGGREGSRSGQMERVNCSAVTKEASADAWRALNLRWPFPCPEFGQEARTSYSYIHLIGGVTCEA